METITTKLMRTFVMFLLVAGAATMAGVGSAGDLASEASEYPSMSSPVSFFIRKASATVDVQPKGNYADIAFTTKEPTHASVEVSTTRSANFTGTTPAGQPPAPAFPAGAVTMSRNDALGDKQTQHTFRMDGLAPHRTYFYVITTTGADGRTYRYSDSFQTPDSRRVKVVFEKINFTRKSLGTYPVYVDGKYAGEAHYEKLQLHGAVNGQWGTPETGYWRYPRDGAFVDIGGSTPFRSRQYQPAGWEAISISAMIENAADQVPLKLLAFDQRSTTIFNRGLLANPTFPADPRPSVYAGPPVDAGREDYDEFWSTATGEIDTTMGGTNQAGTGSFRLVQTREAIDAATDPKFGYGLIFEVMGRFEVSYVNPTSPVAKKPDRAAINELFAAARPPVKAVGRVRLVPGTTPGPARPICEVAQEARARNSPAAPGLEATCAAQARLGVPALAAKGEAIANEDVSAVELRNQQQDNYARRGFDIGMAAAEGQTEPGPGKQKIHDVLGSSEQGGYDAAVSFSLARNKHRGLVTAGAAIAAADPTVAQVRAAETGVLYRQGFDIATGIFGDPALGALGNTAKGPGSLGIRNSLSAAGQRGFDAAADFHLSRHYAH